MRVHRRPRTLNYIPRDTSCCERGGATNQRPVITYLVPPRRLAMRPRRSRGRHAFEKSNESRSSRRRTFRPARAAIKRSQAAILDPFSRFPRFPRFRRLINDSFSHFFSQVSSIAFARLIRCLGQNDRGRCLGEMQSREFRPVDIFN